LTKYDQFFLFFFAASRFFAADSGSSHGLTEVSLGPLGVAVLASAR
jgi:hypothetical protein